MGGAARENVSLCPPLGLNSRNSRSEEPMKVDVSSLQVLLHLGSLKHVNRS